MTFLTTSANFEFLSLVALNKKGEVVQIKSLKEMFDHLVHVKWTSGPKEGQEGFLLCSHKCQWPEELVDGADFLEGCYTPSEYKEDPRLVLGFHPDSVTLWKEEEREISTETCSPGEGKSFQRYWALGFDEIDAPIPFRRRLLACWRIFCKNARAGLTKENMFVGLEEQVLANLIPISLHVFSYMNHVLSQEGVYLDLVFQESLPEYQNCVVNNNIVTVTVNGNGYAVAQSIPYLEYMEYNNECYWITQVIEDYPEYGWGKAEEIP